ncbi:MAG: VCBS repeat-containing protein, partial [Chitinophagia bacterium]|nr:VCBS repeat-containing protein [Chitinophagia bacterium]
MLNIVRNTTTSAATPTFATRVGINMGSAQACVAIADFNLDGKADIAVTQPAGRIAVVQNNSTPGTISFGIPANYTTGAVPTGICAADLDGDGLPDLVSANSGYTGFSYMGNTLSVIRNTYSGSGMSFGTASTLSGGSAPLDVTAADLDGDGKLDLISTDINDGTFSTYRNNSPTAGIISFASRSSYYSGIAATGICVADINSDGKTDVIVSNAVSNTISIFRNTTATSIFSFAPRVDKNTSTGPTTLNIADLDGDNFPDIVVGNQNTNTISVFKNYPLPNSAFSGAPSVCESASTRFVAAVNGGTWSVTPGTASITPTGILTGVAGGTANVTYTLVIGGDTSFSTNMVIVTPLPHSGAITGATSTCSGTSTLLTNATATGAGSWSSSNPFIAMVMPT